MHRQFSHSTIWSLRLGSLHFIANIFILILGTSSLLECGYTESSNKNLERYYPQDQHHLQSNNRCLIWPIYCYIIITKALSAAAIIKACH